MGTLSAAQQRAALLTFCHDLEAPDVSGDTRRFLLALDVLRVLLRISHDGPQLLALQHLHRLRRKSRFRSVRDEIFNFLWDTRLLHDDYEQWLSKGCERHVASLPHPLA